MCSWKIIQNLTHFLQVCVFEITQSYSESSVLHVYSNAQLVHKERDIWQKQKYGKTRESQKGCRIFSKSLKESFLNVPQSVGL